MERSVSLFVNPADDTMPAERLPRHSFLLISGKSRRTEFRADPQERRRKNKRGQKGKKRIFNRKFLAVR